MVVVAGAIMLEVYARGAYGAIRELGSGSANAAATQAHNTTNLNIVVTVDRTWSN